MKRRVIDGKVYDMDTAELVWGDPVRDEQVIVLYRTHHAAFFFYERYLVPCRDEYGDPQAELKEDIFPCTDERAQEFLEKHGNELVEKYFGEMPEGGSTERRFTLRLLNSLAKKLEELAKTDAMSMNSYINRCLGRCVAEEPTDLSAVDVRGVEAMPLEVPEKIMRRSYQRSGGVAAGTPLSSGAIQATVAFTPPIFDEVKLLADKSGMSFSEMVRQLVDIGRSGKGTAAGHG